MGRWFVVLLVVAALAVPGCARRHCVPESISHTRNLVDLGAAADSHAPVEAGVTREVEAEFRKRIATKHPAGARPYNFLALSGGGMYGSFGVGVLNGWTETGTRPEFDVVTGISTGALIATYAFLGPQYDATLKDNILGVTRGDILRRRSILHRFPGSCFAALFPVRGGQSFAGPEFNLSVDEAHDPGDGHTTNIDSVVCER